jgi:hypothetical protein
MLTFPIPLITCSNNGISIYSVIPVFNSWKTFDKTIIPFPKGKDSEHIKLVRQTIPKQLTYLKRFFSKKASTEVSESRPGYDVILELKENVIKIKTPYYQTPIQYLLFEKEYTDKLLCIRFIKRYVNDDPVLTLFVSKFHFIDF